MVSIIVGVPLMGLAAFVLLRPPATPVEARLDRASETSLSPTSTVTTPNSLTSITTVVTSDVSPSTVTVHVAGRVVRADVYTLPEGSRVVDAVDAAGGAATFADLDAVNLASLLVDGQQVYVPAVGEAPRPAPSSANALVPGESMSFSPVNINTADESALDSLPGIGPATARAIIAYRDEHGSFATVDALDEVPGIGRAKVANLDGLVTV